LMLDEAGENAKLLAQVPAFLRWSEAQLGWFKLELGRINRVHGVHQALSNQLTWIWCCAQA
jgi:hypothetical protein